MQLRRGRPLIDGIFYPPVDSEDALDVGGAKPQSRVAKWREARLGALRRSGKSQRSSLYPLTFRSSGRERLN